MASDLDKGAYAEVLAALLHAADVLHGDAKHLGKLLLSPTMRRTKLGDPAPDIADDSVRRSMSQMHAQEGSRFGGDEKASELM